MTITKPIPKATLPVGTHIVGPYAVPAGMSSFAITADFSQAVGDGNSVDIGIETSEDGGATWGRISGGLLAGGCSYPDADGNDWSCGSSFGVLIQQDDGSITGEPDTSRPAVEAQAVIVVVGAALVVARGTLVVS